MDSNSWRKGREEERVEKKREEGKEKRRRERGEKMKERKGEIIVMYTKTH